MILIQNYAQRKRMSEALNVLEALLTWMQLFLKQLVDSTDPVWRDTQHLQDALLSTRAEGADSLSCKQHRGPASTGLIMLHRRCLLPALLPGLRISIPARKKALSKREDPQNLSPYQTIMYQQCAQQTEALAVKIYLSLQNSFASWALLRIRAVRREGNSLLDIQRKQGLSDLGYNEVVHCRGWSEVGKAILAAAGMLLRLPSLCCPCAPGTGVSLQKVKAATRAKPKALFSFDLNHHVVVVMPLVMPHDGYPSTSLSPV